jgi:hypothetical protein
MTVLSGGLFVMGSPDNEPGRGRDEGPQREVSVAPFAMGKYEVTFSQWDACLAGGGCNGYSPPDGGWGRGDRPVTGVSWQDAHAYVDWLNGQAGGDRAIGCRAKLNGNTQHALAKTKPTRSARVSPRRKRHSGCAKRHQSARTPATPSICSTCTAMRASGSRIATPRITISRRSMALRCRPMIAVAVSIAAAATTTKRRFCARPLAARRKRTHARKASASASRARWIDSAPPSDCTVTEGTDLALLIRFMLRSGKRTEKLGQGAHERSLPPRADF